MVIVAHVEWEGWAPGAEELMLTTVPGLSKPASPNLISQLSSEGNSGLSHK